LVYEKDNVNPNVPVYIENLTNGVYYVKIVDIDKSVVQLLTIAN
jgi:hypothetical protein